MKGSFKQLVALLIISILCIFAVGCVCGGGDKTPVPTPVVEEPVVEPTEEVPEETGFEEGDTVAAPLSSGFYLGTVEEVDGEDVKVLYTDDKEVRDLMADELILVKEDEWDEGDRVIAVWSSGKFYPATVEEVKDDSYVVKWDDGSAATEVEPGKILSISALFAEEGDSDSGLEIGQIVAAPWSNLLYLSTVIRVDGDKVDVLYSDGTLGTDLDVADLVILEENTFFSRRACNGSLERRKIF